MLGGLYTLPESFFNTARCAPLPGASTGNDIAANLQSVSLNSDENSIQARTNSDTQQCAASSSETQPQDNSWREAGATCLACGIGIGSPGFTSPADQRAHFKTDWHRYNIKRRLLKQQPVSEEQFEAIINDEQSEVSSISGSSSEDDEDSHARRPRGVDELPRVTFRTQEGQPFCVWRCLVERDHVKSHQEPLSAEQQLCQLQQLRQGPGIFVVILLRGGHFAAAVFQVRQQQASKQQPKSQTQAGATAQSPSQQAQGQSSKQPAKSPDVLEVIAHKTFHRYVVRAKAGGKQSSKDATGKYARSAGSALRRYNEAAMDREIAELLASWKPHLDAASLIFVQAPSSNAKSVFQTSSEVATALQDSSRATSMAAAGAPSSKALINPSDSRVRRIPFVTQRPTFTEARRVIALLLSVFEPTATAVAEEQAAAEAVIAAAERKAQQEQQRKQQKQQQQQSQPADTDDAPTQPELEETHLHTAARAGDSKAIMSLLETCDPCIRDSWGRTAYAVSANKDVRDAFRRYMAQSPDQWDYTAAGVPCALTEELQATQAAKRAEKRARQKAKAKEKKEVSEEAKAAAEAAAQVAIADEIARAAAEAAALAAKLNQAPSKGSAANKGKVGSQAKSNGQASTSKSTSAAGRPGSSSAAQQVPLTPEEMARRREMMAAAAEARMKALQQASSQQRLYS